MKNMFENGHELYWAKVRPEAKVPTKDDENAGYDIYACFDEDYLLIPTSCTALVPTGIAAAVSDDYYLQAEERGSTGSKSMKKSAGVVDSGYRGEIFIAITNCGYKDILISKLSLDELKEKYPEATFYYKDSLIDNYNSVEYDYESKIFMPLIYPYDKAIAQLIVHKVHKMDEQAISYDDLKAIPSKRGAGALGSSGK